MLHKTNLFIFAIFLNCVNHQAVFPLCELPMHNYEKHYRCPEAKQKSYFSFTRKFCTRSPNESWWLGAQINTDPWWRNVSNLLDRWLMVDLDPRELGTEREGREAATCELPKYVSWMSWRILRTHAIFTSRLEAFRITCKRSVQPCGEPWLRGVRHRQHGWNVAVVSASSCSNIDPHPTGLRHPPPPRRMRKINETDHLILVHASEENINY